MDLLSSIQFRKISTSGVAWNSVIFSAAVWTLLYLLFSPPNYTQHVDLRHYNGPCPRVLNARQDWTRVDVPGEHPGQIQGIIEQHQQKMLEQEGQKAGALTYVDCAALLNGDEANIDFAMGYNWCHDERPSDYIYTQIASTNCDTFRDIFGYRYENIPEEELNFPIAFSILTYEDTHQTERLLHAIYRPQNVYCIHVDAKADSSLLEAINAISKCLPNVIVPKNNINVHWAEYSVLEAELLCMQSVWDSDIKWKYYINLTGREYPLKTNSELVKILSAYNGANDIDGNMYNRNVDWMKYVWRAENWRTNTLKSPVPHGYNIFKGSAHIVATRAFIEYVLTNEKARDLREWMRDTRLPDEHYFNTLNHNPHFDIPGSYKGDPALKPFYGRLKLWWQNEDSTCSGEWSRYICNLGPRELPTVIKSKHLFVNKIRRDTTPVAYDCLNQWHSNRTRTQSTKEEQLDIQFYKDLKFVKNHV